MVKQSWDNAYDVKTVSAKLSQLDFNTFKVHCETKGLTPSALIKELIKNEVNHPAPLNIAGKNLFSYNKNKDNFNWQVILDNDLKVDVEDNLTAEYVNQLFESLKQAIDERNTYLKKQKTDSTSIPRNIIRGKI